MKKLIFTYFLLLSLNNILAQEIKSLSFVLVVDDEIITKQSRLSFTVITDTSTDTVYAKYFPGTLSMSILDYEKLVSPNVKSVLLKYSDSVYIDGKENKYDFQIEYQKKWLQDLYNILKFYNLNCKKNKKKFKPLSENKNYTFELISPNLTLLRIRKR